MTYRTDQLKARIGQLFRDPEVKGKISPRSLRTLVDKYTDFFRPTQTKTLSALVNTLESIREGDREGLTVKDVENYRKNRAVPMTRTEIRNFEARPAVNVGRAFRGRTESYQLDITARERDRIVIDDVLNRTKLGIKRLARERLERTNRPLVLLVTPKLGGITDGERVSLGYVSTRKITLNNIAEFDEKYDAALSALRTKLDNKYSGDIVEQAAGSDDINVSNRGDIRADSIAVHMADYSPIRGSSYMPLPKWIASKKACVNPQNDDDKCFMWAILAALHPAEKDADRISKYKKFISNYDWSMLNFPVDVNSIEINLFERANKIAVNLYGVSEGNTIVPIRISELPRGDDIQRVNLLFFETCNIEYDLAEQFQNGGSKIRRKLPESAVSEKNGHFVWIKDMSKLLSSQTSKDGHKCFFCNTCLRKFSDEAKCIEHEKHCKPSESYTVIEMPDEQSQIYFKEYHKMLRCPYAIYTDSEAYNTKVEDNSCKNTTQLTEHKPASFHYMIRCSNGWSLPEGISQFSPIFDNPVEYMQHLSDVSARLVEHIKTVAQDKENYKPMTTLSKEQHEEFERATTCHICNGAFRHEEGCDKFTKVRDHCHVTGQYRGPAHKSCNLNLNYNKVTKIPVFFHNGRGYDWHLLIKSLAKVPDMSKKIELIPKNFEQYLAWWGGNCMFLDSAAFYAPGASLEALVEGLLKSRRPIREVMPALAEAFPHCNGRQLHLIARKGIFPYEWFDCHEKMDATELPPIEDFFSCLSGSTISQEDYDHAQLVWKEFGCKTFRDYHDLYLRCDVAQLCDVFEAYRDVAMSAYGLDPCHFFSASNMAWSAMLKITGVKLDMICDQSMYEFFEAGMRGGVSMISHRHARANNKYLSTYDPSKRSSFIQYLDCNNLYGASMKRLLPHKNFKWVEASQLTKMDHEYIANLNPNAKIGYTLEVDIEYPQHLHDKHNCYPLAPEKRKIRPYMISQFNQELAQTHDVSDIAEKLLPNLEDKTKYVVHLTTLQLYMKLGLRVTKVHRAVKYHQSNWLEKYIDTNTAMRAKATTDIEKDFYKLMNNSVFGKTMENVRDRTVIRLRTQEKNFLSDVASPNCTSWKIYDEDLVATQHKRARVVLNKPIYVGQAVLDLSKSLMYDFWYTFLKPKYGDDLRLLATDTDSLMFQVFTEDWYKDVQNNADYFDLSEMDKDNELLGWLHSNENKKVVGKFKDETGVVPIREFVGIKPKVYSFKLDDDKDKKTLKGIKKGVVKREIKFEDYKACLFPKVSVDGFDHRCQQHSQTQIRSKDHTLSTLSVNKRSLFAYDTKRYILSDGLTSYAHGHYKIAELSCE
jgi:hypothetical protein